MADNSGETVDFTFFDENGGQNAYVGEVDLQSLEADVSVADQASGRRVINQALES